MTTEDWNAGNYTETLPRLPMLMKIKTGSDFVRTMYECTYTTGANVWRFPTNHLIETED